MKNRKWIALALAAAMVGSLTACGGGLRGCRSADERI